MSKPWSRFEKVFPIKKAIRDTTMIRIFKHGRFFLQKGFADERSAIPLFWNRWEQGFLLRPRVEWVYDFLSVLIKAANEANGIDSINIARSIDNE